MFQLGGISVISLDHQVVPLKKSMVCLRIKYAHDTIGSYSHSSVKNACYAMCRCMETNKYARVYVCICMCVRKSGILIWLVFAIPLGYSSIHLESHMTYRWRLCALLTWTCPLFSPPPPQGNKRRKEHAQWRSGQLWSPLCQEESWRR